MFPSELVGVTLTPDNAVMHGILERLAQYEDAEAEGRLVQLPCKVGDTVYRFRYTGIKDDVIIVPWTITAITVGKDGLTAYIRNGVDSLFFNPVTDFGRSVYRTESEAEAALAKWLGDTK